MDDSKDIVDRFTMHIKNFCFKCNYPDGKSFWYEPSFLHVMLYLYSISPRAYGLIKESFLFPLPSIAISQMNDNRMIEGSKESLVYLQCRCNLVVKKEYKHVCIISNLNCR